MYEVYGGVYGWVCKVTILQRSAYRQWGTHVAMRLRLIQLAAVFAAVLALSALALLVFSRGSEHLVVFSIVPNAEQQPIARTMLINGYAVRLPLARHTLRGTVSIGDELFTIASYSQSNRHCQGHRLYNITARAINSSSKHHVVSLLLLGDILDSSVTSASVILTSKLGDDIVFSAIRAP